MGTLFSAFSTDLCLQREGLLQAVSRAATRDVRSQSATLGLRYAHSPDLVYRYSVGNPPSRSIYVA